MRIKRRAVLIRLYRAAHTQWTLIVTTIDRSSRSAAMKCRYQICLAALLRVLWHCTRNWIVSLFLFFCAEQVKQWRQNTRFDFIWLQVHLFCSGTRIIANLWASSKEIFHGFSPHSLKEVTSKSAHEMTDAAQWLNALKRALYLEFLLARLRVKCVVAQLRDDFRLFITANNRTSAVTKFEQAFLACSLKSCNAHFFPLIGKDHEVWGSRLRWGYFSVLFTLRALVILKLIENEEIDRTLFKLKQHCVSSAGPRIAK